MDECLAGRVLVLDADLDHVSAADVRQELHAAIDRAEADLVIDLRQVRAVDAGLGLLLGAHRRADRAGRRLVLREVPPTLGRLLLRTRLHRILHVEGSLAGG